MSETPPPNPLAQFAEMLREHGLTAAINALIGGCLALAAAVTHRAFTNEAMLDRLDRELLAERERLERQRAEDCEADTARLARIETDIREIRDLVFTAFQQKPGG